MLNFVRRGRGKKKDVKKKTRAHRRWLLPLYNAKPTCKQVMYRMSINDTIDSRLDQTGVRSIRFSLSSDNERFCG